MKNYKKDIDKLKKNGFLSEKAHDHTSKIIERLRDEVKDKKKSNDDALKNSGINLEEVHFINRTILAI